MAVFHAHTVRCVCKNNLRVNLADSINVQRSPRTREAILRGELHRATCSKCGRRMTVEKPFYYTDVARNALFRVMPRGERHLFREASSALDRASSLLTGAKSEERPRTLRVLFGMDELREKLVAQDAELDDRLVELLKVLLVYEHPVLLKRARLRLTLARVHEDELEFFAVYEHHQQRFRLKMPLDIARNLAENPNRLVRWTKAAHQKSVFALPDHWVNIWRWSPQPLALSALKAYASLAREGKAIDTKALPFRRMLTSLPRGSHLPGWAKADLRDLFDYAKKKKLGKLEDDLFEIRFGVELEDDWSKNKDRDDIDTLWTLLKNLPDTNVEGNTALHELLLDAGDDGGSYSPESHDISIGSKELVNAEGFEDVVRHEVGHAVHEAKPALVDGFLKSRFGWRTFGTKSDEIDEWVGLMGGYSDLTETQRGQVRTYLRTALGGGSSWSPGPTPTPPAGHPWHRPNFGPRLAFEQTGADWYTNFKTWYRADGKAFFLNYWYQTLIVVDHRAIDLIAEMPDNYAAMSHFEFFAELYALYYDLDDPKRPKIPADVMAWLEKHIGKPSANAPKRPSKSNGRRARRADASP